MKFAVSKENFTAGLKRAQGITAGSAIMTILSNLLLKTTKDGVEITATNYVVGVRSFVNATIEEEGSIAVNAKKLYEIAKSLPEDVCFCSASGGNLEIRSGKARFELTGALEEDYPLFPQYSYNDEFFFMKATTFINMLRKTFFSIPTDETKYTASGLYIGKDGDAIVMVSTDGYRLSLAKKAGVRGLGFLGEGIILPRKGVEELIKLIAEEKSLDVGLGLARDGVSIVFAVNGTNHNVLAIKPVEERFFDYKILIPKENDKPMMVNRLEFLSVLKRVSILSGLTTKEIKLNFANNSMVVSGKTIIGEAAEEMEVEYTKEEMEIICDAQYLIEPLSVIEDEVVVLEFKDPSSAIVIKPYNSEEYMCLVMPMTQ